ncbi:hypothetical protein RB595_003579 [Gaeumannomyces hyphopodioides]
MASIWNPEEVLGLRPEGDQTQGVWRCVARVPKVALDGGAVEDDGTQRCQRPIRPCEHNTIRRLLADMSHELPDQVDHNLLLHLARACLCVDATPEPHRGRQEASVIYEWTELMCNEAWRLREPTPSDPFTRDPFKAESSASSSVARAEEKKAWDEDAALSPRSLPRRIVSARARLQSSSASTISQRRGGNSPLALSSSASARTPTATATTALTLSTAHSSAHHPHAPPSPPDSATFSDGRMTSSTGISVFPNLPIYHPVPLSFDTTTSSTMSSTSASFIPARPSIISPPLRTGTTIQTSSASSDQLSVGSASTVNAADDEDDDDEEAVPDTPYAGTVFEVASTSASPTTATTAYATVPASFINSTVPPPLPTATTIITEGSSNCSSVISSTGDSSVARADDSNMGCAIMSMPPRASVAAAEVAARHQKRQQLRQQLQRQNGRTLPQPPPSQGVGARGRQRSRSRPDNLHLRRVSLSNIRRAELGNSSSAADLAKAASIGPGDSVSVRHLRHSPVPQPQQNPQQQEQEFPPVSAAGISFSSSSSVAAAPADAAPPAPLTPSAKSTEAGAAEATAEAAMLVGQLRECADALRGARAACVEGLEAARSELAAVRTEVAAVRADLLEMRKAAEGVVAVAAVAVTTTTETNGPDDDVAVASMSTVPPSPLRYAPHLLLLPLVILVWAAEALVRRLRVDGGGGLWVLKRRTRRGDGEGILGITPAPRGVDGGVGGDGSLLPLLPHHSPVPWARAVGCALAAAAAPVARLADLATAYGEGGGRGVVAVEPLRRRPEEVVKGKDSVGKMV